MDLSSKLTANSDVISELFSRMGSFEERLQKATSPPLPAHSDLSELAHEFAEFKATVWQALSRLKAQTDLLSLGLERHENYMRRRVLLFHGVPESKDEKVSDVVVRVLHDKMQLTDLTSTDLESCHRLGHLSTKSRPILVRFHDLEHRRLIWDTKTTLRDTGIIVSEFLTKSRHDVFMAARKHFTVRNCWTSEGKIVILLPDKSRRKIEILSELQSLIAQYPAAKISESVGVAKGSERTAPLKTAARPAGFASSSSSRNLRNRPT